MSAEMDDFDIDPFAPVEMDEDMVNALDDDFGDDDAEEDDSMGEFVLACHTPGCLMPGLHWTSECYTIEDVKDYEREKEEANV